MTPFPDTKMNGRKHASEREPPAMAVQPFYGSPHKTQLVKGLMTSK